jgi:hypothetical protein
MKKMKKLIAVIIVSMMVAGFNVVPAEAYTYTELVTPTSVTATGTITGITATFSVDVVSQTTGASTTLVFDETSGATADSGKALKITGKANQVDTRIIAYTDNATYFSPGQDPTKDENGDPTGIDGSGMVGVDNAGYAVALLWGVKSADNYEPNVLENYGFDGDAGNGIGDVYIVDVGHKHSFVPNETPPSTLDTQVMFDVNGVSVPNPAEADPATGFLGLYPQRWDEDLYDSTNPATRNVVSPALYKTIATIAFGIGEGTNDSGLSDQGWYACQVAKLTTPESEDSVRAKLGAVAGSGNTDAYLYIYIAGNFGGKPAQVYTTNYLNLAIVQD